KYTYKFKQARAVPGLVYWKPRTPGLRHKISIDYDFLGVYTGAPHKDLSAAVPKLSGRNNHGRITARHRGGGMKKVLRQVDYSREKVDGIPGVVERVEKDPNRSGFLALVKYQPEGQLPIFKYHLAPAEIKAGDVLLSGDGAPVQAGSTLPLRSIPLGTPIHNLELTPGKGGQLARAANVSAVIQSKQLENAIVKLPSGEIRLINLDCRATVGRVSNHLQRMINYGKAGERRKLGWRPSVRGIAKNPNDHPHGGRTNGGRPSCTPWGVYCKGQRTRRRNNYTNKFIITRKGGQPIRKFAEAKKLKAR
uniref:uL2m n=1 Tax=Polytomella magna TaxID=353565 RepID=UPI002240E4BF|nr:Chain Aa, uL2m [Polytomella magna]8APN_Aa Chain Aa, uL2m [Polytomella magna]8APO_Aa Chain Aa, uL2m [Polytomella magna]